jgi:hypothetical protein
MHSLVSAPDLMDTLPGGQVNEGDAFGFDGSGRDRGTVELDPGG